MVGKKRSSSTSGGSLSTTYTSGSSHLLSSSSGDGSLTQLVEERENMSTYIMCLVQEFTAAGVDEDAASLVLERWLSDLGVSWVLGMGMATDGKSLAGSCVFPRRLGDLARSWIDALTVINRSIFMYFNGLCNHKEFARFLRSTLLKIIPFADAVTSAKVDGPCIQHNLLEAMVPAEEKLQALIGVRHALSEASQHIQVWSLCQSFQEPRGVAEQLSSFVSAKLAKLDEAVWDTVDEVRTIIMSLTDNHNVADSVDPQILERSLDVHRATRCTVNCINVLTTNYWLVSQIVLEAPSLGKYVPRDNRISHLFIADPLAMLIMEIISCLQENLARVSQPFPDQSLRFLFLLNNTHFMWQQIRHHPSYALGLYMPALARKIDEHIQRYLEMSWIPVVSDSGLLDPTPLCLGRYSPLAKFESKFQKTYAAQKLWKVPNPELRRRLRKAIIETVIPAFTKYLEDNKITAPRVTQQELEDMLQDLFEG
ncbi:unnamed protein product [Urochloa humidicola]